MEHLIHGLRDVWRQSAHMWSSTDEEIIATIIEERSAADETDDDDTDDDDVEHTSTQPAFAEAVNAIEILQRYLMTVESIEQIQEKITESNIFLTSIRKKSTQKTVTDFFK